MHVELAVQRGEAVVRPVAGRVSSAGDRKVRPFHLDGVVSVKILKPHCAGWRSYSVHINPSETGAPGMGTSGGKEKVGAGLAFKLNRPWAAFILPAPRHRRDGGGKGKWDVRE